eukprot:5626216-Amphidinium_carterae.1
MELRSCASRKSFCSLGIVAVQWGMCLAIGERTSTGNRDQQREIIASQEVLASWRCIVEDCDESYAVLSQIASAETQGAGVDALADIFANKATATLKLRQRSIQQFAAWLKENTVCSGLVFPPTEQQSRASTLIELLAFLSSTFEGTEFRASNRIKGAVSGGSQTVARRAPFSARAVEKMELLITNV